MIDKKKSIYSDILCDLCQVKKYNDYCSDCKNKYNCAKVIKGSKKKKKIGTDGQNPIIEKPIILDRSIQTNQLDPNNVINYDSENYSVCEISHSEVSYNADLSNKFILPTYADLLCTACQNKHYKDICNECKLKYMRASSKKYRVKKKQKQSLETINLDNQPNVTDHYQLVQDDSGTCDNSLTKKRKNSAKTTKNNVSKARKIVHTPNRQEDLGVGFIESLPKPNKINAIRRLNFNSDQNVRAEISAGVVLDIKEKFGGKSDVCYQVITALSPNFSGKTQTQIKNILKVSWENAGKVKSRVSLSRKMKRKKLTQEIITKIETFYEREDISRLEPSMKASKKWGSKRFLKFSINDAYLMFRNENIDVQVCFSNFYKFKPRNVKIASKTPIISSLCPYCLNIRLKLQKLGIPNLKLEHELFKKLICDKDHGVLENADCIQNKCKDCSDWVGQLEILLSNTSYKNKDIITWYTWEKESIVRANGMKGVRRI